MVRTFCPLLLLVGCMEPPDPWTQATAACAEGEAACHEALAVDLGLDPEMAPEPRQALLAAGEKLLTWDLGPWPPATDDYVRQPFVDWLEAMPGETTAARLYNRIARTVQVTTTGPMEWQTAKYSDGRVTFNDETDSLVSPPVDLAVTYAHEAAHERWPGHDDCDGIDCDRSWASAYGMGGTVAWLAWENDCGGEGCSWLYWTARDVEDVYVQPAE